MENLSVGERYRVRLACKLAERADILLLDEPTNHLDDAAIEYLTETITKWRGGIALVTHDRQLLDDVATAILDLDPSIDGKPTLYGQPGYERYRAKKEQALKRWRRRYQAEQKLEAELLEQRDETYEGLSDEWRPPKGSQPHRRATRARIHVKAADRAIERLEAERVNVPEPPIPLSFPELPAREPTWAKQEVSLLTLDSPLVVGNSGNVRLDLPEFHFVLPPGGRLLVTGPNGSGKSTLLNAITGRLPLTSGTRTAIKGLRIGIVGQENETIAINATDDAAKITGFEAAANQVLTLLSRGQLDPEQVNPIAAMGLLAEADLDRPLADLSAGQRRRFELARALIAAPHLLIFDEPTNHLSIDLIDELTAALKRTKAAVIVATHDRRMRNDLAAWPTLNLE
jgi:macrolide transport system ATP-binding/permease protein